MQVNDTFNIETGRIYQTVQVLRCQIAKVETIKDGRNIVTVNVIDDVLDMRFNVAIQVDIDDSFDETEDLILNQYDSGNYEDGLALIEGHIQLGDLITAIAEHEENGVTHFTEGDEYRVLSVNKSSVVVEGDCSVRISIPNHKWIKAGEDNGY
ncbi:hypothetical protein KP803_00675 [Vibrio sp. ZSDE26]|uniref:Uncharacterized protein n=1 Tax=Vibrio amylolyticus TaxID=2847292 RepID=A0A9X1XFF2_9VIBR|nr:hypothetical protein [Vibrio amylolyticus]MCK6261781.1 hypothetical protein [Vibrio amylolyticus]